MLVDQPCEMVENDFGGKSEEYFKCSDIEPVLKDRERLLGLIISGELIPKENHEIVLKEKERLERENEELRKKLNDAGEAYDYRGDQLFELKKKLDKARVAIVSLLDHAREYRIVEEARLGEARAKATQSGYYDDILMAESALKEIE